MGAHVTDVDPTDTCQVVCAWSLWCPVCGEVHPIDVETTGGRQVKAWGR